MLCNPLLCYDDGDYDKDGAMRTTTSMWTWRRWYCGIVVERFPSWIPAHWNTELQLLIACEFSRCCLRLVSNHSIRWRPETRRRHQRDSRESSRWTCKLSWVTIWPSICSSCSDWSLRPESLWWFIPCLDLFLGILCLGGIVHRLNINK